MSKISGLIVLSIILFSSLYGEEYSSFMDYGSQEGFYAYSDFKPYEKDKKDDKPVITEAEKVKEYKEYKKVENIDQLQADYQQSLSNLMKFRDLPSAKIYIENMIKIYKEKIHLQNIVKEAALGMGLKNNDFQNENVLPLMTGQVIVGIFLDYKILKYNKVAEAVAVNLKTKGFDYYIVVTDGGSKYDIPQKMLMESSKVFSDVSGEIKKKFNINELPAVIAFVPSDGTYYLLSSGNISPEAVENGLTDFYHKYKSGLLGNKQEKF
ncbi:MAG: hypothetical protein HPY53_11100 [Brevinematales bacterium]|nr:hypothetical protein [Brevinematales bacterium]